MNYDTNLANLRNLVNQALELKLFDNPESKAFYEGTLIQILNEIEKQRQNCVATADDYRRKAQELDGRAFGLAYVGSIICNVVNGFVKLEEKRLREQSSDNQD